MIKPIKLTGEQKNVLFLPPKNPIQIKGVAGSGKTTVALYRAKHLLDSHSDLFSETKVAIFTYNKTLAEYIRQISHRIEGGYQHDSNDLIPLSEPGFDVTITNFHKWAFRFLESNGIKLSEIVFNNGYPDRIGKTISTETQLEILNSIKSHYIESAIVKKTAEFFRDEISWIKGKLIDNETEYLDAKRTGRGTNDRVLKEDKIIIWKIYGEYEKYLREKGLYDFDDYAIYSLKLINETTDFNPPFSHLIIDEAQDLNKAQILVLTKLVSPETNSISIIADAAQRIFKSGFTWAEVGLNVRGARTVEFKKNYRNTVHIARAALSLLDKEPDKTDFTIVETALKGDKKPILGYFENQKTQLNYLKEELEKLRNENNLNDTVILHRSNSGVDTVAQDLTNSGFSIEHIKKTKNQTVNYNSNSIKVCTLSSIKGLEFTSVFIIDLNEGVIPYPPGFNDEDDEYHISTERRLLYTAMTRARSNLYLLTSGDPSRYINEINSDLVEIYSELL
ncbi:MAG: UvrD-helicase domain-containing protein [Dysgonomonas sp.]